MAIKGYLAMTAAEFEKAEALPPHIAWMACHFSCYGTGLTNLPRRLPEGAMVIVNDRTPVYGHDPGLILAQLEQLAQELKPAGFLLDLQRPAVAETKKIAMLLTEKLTCPVGVSEQYADDLDCPVFLSMPPPHRDAAEYLSAWKGRDIWLEAATETEIATVTAEGCQFLPVIHGQLPEPSFADNRLHCRYHIELMEDRAVFTLQRTVQEVYALLEDAEKLGVVQTVGLYQQLGTGVPNGI